MTMTEANKSNANTIEVETSINGGDLVLSNELQANNKTQAILRNLRRAVDPSESAEKADIHQWLKDIEEGLETYKR